MFIFPGMGFGAVMVKAKEVTHAHVCRNLEILNSVADKEPKKLDFRNDTKSLIDAFGKLREVVGVLREVLCLVCN